MKMEQKLKWVMIVMLALVNGWYCCYGCWEEERIALLQLKAHNNHPNGTSLPDWVEDKMDVDCCIWSRVVCNTTTRRVTQLNLQLVRGFNSEDWYFNASILLHFEKLEELDLSDNQMGGWVENEGFERVSSRLRNLKVLYLFGNHLNNSIVSSLSGLSSLKSLYLFDNRLKGSIQIKDGFSNLEKLDIRENLIDKFIIPKGTKSLSKVQALYLDRCCTKASILLQLLGTISSLKTLWFRFNSAEEINITQVLHSLSNLEELVLDLSSLNNNFLQYIGGLTSLKVLSLWRCGLNGTLTGEGLCQLKNLEELSLCENDFVGPLPSCLGNMKFLRLLDISHNQFTGNIAFSPLIKLTSLEVLSISSNPLQVPMSFKSFANNSNLKVIFSDNNNLIAETTFQTWAPMFQLKVLTLSNCTIEGLDVGLLSFLYYQYDLRIVNLSHTSFKGMFPAWLLNNNTRLESLFIRNISFTGFFPWPSHSCHTISEIDISDNYLHGQIPKNMSSMFPNLWALNMSWNMLTDEIPSCIGNLSSLEFLDLSDNHLSGVFPRLIGNFLNIKAIAMSNNHLEGPIPAEFCKFSNLVSLDLSENYLSDSIPSSCFNSSSLINVHLNKNRLSGPLTRAFDNSSSLVTLDLSYNNLSGRIPDWIGNLSDLSVLLLKVNHFEGAIPNNICQVKQLTLLDLSQNHLTGPIPCCLGNLNFKAPIYDTLGDLSWSFPMPMPESKRIKLMLYPDLPLVDVIVAVEFTTKRSSYSYKGDILNNMSGIDLSCNQLSGIIPLEIGNLSNIHALNLSYNNLTGPIPATFSNLNQMESLDLSNNNLNGRIPPQLVAMNFLGTFSVAYNNLSGPTPDMKFQFGTFENSSYEGNPLLCGPPLNNSCNENESTSPMSYPLDGEGEDGSFIDLNVFQVTFVVTYVAVLLGIVAVLYINPYWRRAWFYFIEVCIETCYYFVLDNLRKISNFRNM